MMLTQSRISVSKKDELPQLVAAGAHGYLKIERPTPYQGLTNGWPAPSLLRPKASPHPIFLTGSQAVPHVGNSRVCIYQFLTSNSKALGKREMFGDQTPSNIVWLTNILPFGHLVWCCLIVFGRV